jgi:hypothetical protein
VNLVYLPDQRSLTRADVELLKQPAGTVPSLFNVLGAYLFVLRPCGFLAYFVAEIAVVARSTHLRVGLPAIGALLLELGVWQSRHAIVVRWHKYRALGANGFIEVAGEERRVDSRFDTYTCAKLVAAVFCG